MVRQLNLKYLLNIPENEDKAIIIQLTLFGVVILSYKGTKLFVNVNVLHYKRLLD